MVSIVKTRPQILEKFKDLHHHADGKYYYYYIPPLYTMVLSIVIYCLKTEVRKWSTLVRKRFDLFTKIYGGS